MPFQQFGLRAELLRAIKDKGYETPTPIQLKAIPAVLSGRDLLAGAQTGTGKTAGFTLPLLQKLMANPQPRRPRSTRVLILAPTRELAAQVEESIRDYGKYLSLRSTVVFGGVNINPQITKLKAGVDLLVATPGRLLDLVGQKAVDLSAVEVLVLDEADRMLDMGFIHDIKRVLNLLPKTRQNLLFSATYSDEIKALADKLLNKPELIEVARRNAAAEQVAQVIHPVDRKRKSDLLSHLIRTQDWRQVLVFTRTKHCANRLSEHLQKDGISSAAIHGNKSQGARTKALADFKSGQVRVLVATDIAARGLDIQELPYVANFELPHVPEDYVHRIGRTGRAGNEGKAVSLVCVDEDRLLRDIERLLKRDIEKVVIEGFEVDKNIKAEPILQGRRGQSQGQGQGAGRRPQGGFRNSAPRAPGAPKAPGTSRPSSGGSRPSSGGFRSKEKAGAPKFRKGPQGR